MAIGPSTCDDFVTSETDVEITRQGDEITIRPVQDDARRKELARKKMLETFEALRRMPKSETMERIERTQTRKTLWDADE